MRLQPAQLAFIPVAAIGFYLTRHGYPYALHIAGAVFVAVYFSLRWFRGS